MGKVLQTQEVQGVAPVGTVETGNQLNGQMTASDEMLMAQQSMAVLNQQLQAAGYDEDSYGSYAPDQFRSTMAQDLAGENQYQESFDQGSLGQAGSQGAEAGVPQTSEYNNVLAKLVGTIAEFVGKDTSLGAKLTEMADNLDAGSSSGEYDPANPYHDLNDQQLWDAAGASGEQASENTGLESSGSENVGLENSGSEGTESSGVQADASPLGASGLTESNVAFMSDKANQSVLSGEFLAAGQATDDKPFREMRDTTNSICNELSDDTVNNMVGVDAWEDNSPQKQDSSYKHMSFMRGLSAYSEQAVAGIEEAFANDPEGKETAMKGLNGMMAASVPQAFDALYSNNKSFNFLTEADKAELNSMKFAGTDMTYGEYEAARMEQDGIESEYGTMSVEEADMYANAGLNGLDASDIVADAATGAVVGTVNGNGLSMGVGAATGAALGIAADQAKGNPAMGGAIGGVGMGNSPSGIVSGAVAGATGYQPKTTVQSGASTMTRADKIAMADKMAATVVEQADSTKSYGMGE